MGAVLVLFTAGFMWGFTVDDALISVRYARNLASLAGYRFDPSAPGTDGVTPLPWPFLLSTLAWRADALDVLVRAKVLGLVAGGLTGARIGFALADSGAPRWAKALACAVLAVSVPVAAHVVSGMETSMVILLATLAATERRPGRRAIFAGLSAGFRPEMLPWALALVALSGARRRPDEGPSPAVGAGLSGVGVFRAAWPVAIAATPFALCVAARLVAFGHAAPLAVSAKPSDATHGLAYAGAAFVVCASPIAGFVPLASSRLAVREGGLGPAVVS